MPRVDQEQERYVLPAAGAELRPRQPRLVLHTAAQQVSPLVRTGSCANPTLFSGFKFRPLLRLT